MDIRVIFLRFQSILRHCNWSIRYVMMWLIITSLCACPGCYSILKNFQKITQWSRCIRRSRIWWCPKFRIIWRQRSLRLRWPTSWWRRMWHQTRQSWWYLPIRATKYLDNSWKSQNMNRINCWYSWQLMFSFYTLTRVYRVSSCPTKNSHRYSARRR